MFLRGVARGCLSTPFGEKIARGKYRAEK